jgi:hypothetical protein
MSESFSAVAATRYPKSIRQKEVYDEASHEPMRQWLVVEGGRVWMGEPGGRSDEFLRRHERLREMKARVAELPAHCLQYRTCDEPPNEKAMSAAKLILDALVGFTIEPSRVVVSAEGGISIVFLRDGRRASLECYNTGEIVAAYVGPDRNPVAWEVTDRSIFAAVDRLATDLGRPE